MVRQFRSCVVCKVRVTCAEVLLKSTLTDEIVFIIQLVGCVQCVIKVLLFQGLEATLSDPKKKYPDKVNALLSAWEHVTAFIATSAHEASETLIDWVHRCVCHII